MDIAVFHDHELAVALGALQEIYDSPRARQLCAGLAAAHGVATPSPARVTSLVDAIPSARARQRLLQLAIITALVDGAPERATVSRVRALARALGVRDPGVAVLGHVAAGRRRLARALMTRRIIGRFFLDAWRRAGLAGLRRIIAPLWFARGSDPPVAWRYRALGLLPAGTLGHTLWAHCTERRFSFPGEAGGIPEQLMFHDVGHILTGFNTEPDGEIQQGAFQAGFMRRDGFAILLFVVLQFHLGIKITPVADPEVGYFDVPKVMRALAAGGRCLDLSEGWRIWEDAGRPIAEVRHDYGIAA
ncbi:MAG: hypothetical protein R3A51_12930 [Nannocystaceae bacterium]